MDQGKSLDKAAQAASYAVTDVGTTTEVRKRKKPKPVTSACVQCRRKKTKCSGQRPVCRSCGDGGVECMWQVPEGLTRIDGMKKELQSVLDHINLLEALVKMMQDGSDEESTMLLAKLRLGDSVEKIVSATRTEPASKKYIVE